MAIDFTKKYDIVRIIDIPENEISEQLKEFIKTEIRYKDTNEEEHLYNASQILEALNFEKGLTAEMEAIDELCGKNQSIYFRITKG